MKMHMLWECSGDREVLHRNVIYSKRTLSTRKRRNTRCAKNKFNKEILIRIKSKHNNISIQSALEIFKSIETNDTTFLKISIESLEDINFTFKDYSLFAYAVDQNKPECLQVLFDSKHKDAYHDLSNFYLVDKSVLTGAMKCLEILLKYDYNFGACLERDFDNRTIFLDYDYFYEDGYVEDDGFNKNRLYNQKKGHKMFIDHVYEKNKKRRMYYLLYKFSLYYVFLKNDIEMLKVLLTSDHIDFEVNVWHVSTVCEFDTPNYRDMIMYLLQNKKYECLELVLNDGRILKTKSWSKNYMNYIKESFTAGLKYMDILLKTCAENGIEILLDIIIKDICKRECELDVFYRVLEMNNYKKMFISICLHRITRSLVYYPDHIYQDIDIIKAVILLQDPRIGSLEEDGLNRSLEKNILERRKKYGSSLLSDILYDAVIFRKNKKLMEDECIQKPSSLYIVDVFIAIYNDDVETFDKLMKRFVMNMNNPLIVSSIPLLLAFHYKSIKCFTYLIRDVTVKLDVRSFHGKHILQLCWEFPSFLHKLITAPRFHYTRNKYDLISSDLHNCFNNEKIFKKLLELKLIFPNLKDHLGNTILFDVIQDINLHEIKQKQFRELVFHPEIDLSVKNRENKTVMDVLKKNPENNKRWIGVLNRVKREKGRKNENQYVYVSKKPSRRSKKRNNVPNKVVSPQQGRKDTYIQECTYCSY